MVKTHRYAASVDDTGFASAGVAYLTDACGNVVHGVGQNDSEYHTAPGDEFRIVSPLRPPEGVPGVWAEAGVLVSDWAFDVTLRGSAVSESGRIPDGTYIIEYEVASDGVCSVGGTITGSYTVRTENFLPKVAFQWDWDGSGTRRTALEDTIPWARLNVNVPGTQVLML